MADKKPITPNFDSNMINAVFLSLLTAVSAAELLEIFPEGLKTPEAAFLRVLAYGGQQIKNLSGMVRYVIQCRENPDFGRYKGHKRAAMMSCIATLAHCVAQIKARKMTPDMKKMVTTDFPQGWVEEFAWWFTLSRDAQIEWKKDGGSVTLSVPSALTADAKKWAGIKWAPMNRAADEESNPPGFDEKLDENSNISSISSSIAPPISQLQPPLKPGRPPRPTPLINKPQNMTKKEWNARKRRREQEIQQWDAKYARGDG